MKSNSRRRWVSRGIMSLKRTWLRKKRKEEVLKEMGMTHMEALVAVRAALGRRVTTFTIAVHIGRARSHASENKLYCKPKDKKASLKIRFSRATVTFHLVPKPSRSTHTNWLSVLAPKVRTLTAPDAAHPPRISKLELETLPSSTAQWRGPRRPRHRWLWQKKSYCAIMLRKRSGLSNLEKFQH